MKAFAKWICLGATVVGTTHCAADVAETSIEGSTEQAVNWQTVKAEKPANFRVLVPGVLLAGTHPRPEHLKFLKEKYDIASVLSLQDRLQEAYWPVPSIDGEKRGDLCLRIGNCEKHNAESLGIEYINRKWRVVIPNEVKDSEWIDDTVAVLADKRNHPVYVHCAYGLDRTGAVVALHRVLNDGWTANRAFQEWRSYRPEVCGDHADKVVTFAKKMITERNQRPSMRPGDQSGRFIFNMQMECAKPAPPPPDGFVMQGNTEG